MELGVMALSALIGRCPAMERLRHDIGRTGPSDLRVHVFGETGSGKEKVARALHALSPRARREFVPVNAAGFGDELLAAELFGHTRGAFTGAVTAREGYVAKAEGGTLFIDEVAEMSPVAQVRLLRFLQDGEYQRLGETTTRRADVRVISATNVDLARRAHEGRFRLDLWFRLKDDLVEVPPLRERGDDVLLLARHFLEVHANGSGSPPSLTTAAARALVRCRWPGNVRQLESEMRRLAVHAAGRAVVPEDLSPEVRADTRPECRGLRAELHRLELELVSDALRRNGGVVARAAAELGMTRQALWVRVRRLGLDRGEGRRGAILARLGGGSWETSGRGHRAGSGRGCAR